MFNLFKSKETISFDHVLLCQTEIMMFCEVFLNGRDVGDLSPFLKIDVENKKTKVVIGGSFNNLAGGLCDEGLLDLKYENKVSKIKEYTNEFAVIAWKNPKDPIAQAMLMASMLLKHVIHLEYLFSKNPKINCSSRESKDISELINGNADRLASVCKITGIFEESIFRSLCPTFYLKFRR